MKGPGSLIRYVDDPPEPKFDEDPNVRHPLTGAKPDYWFIIRGGEKEPRWRAPVLKRGDDPAKWWYSIKVLAERCAMNRHTMLAMVKRLAPQLGDMVARPGGSKYFVRGDAIAVIMRGGKEPFGK